MATVDSNISVNAAEEAVEMRHTHDNKADLDNLSSLLDDKLEKDGKAADSALLDGKTPMQLPISEAVQTALDDIVASGGGSESVIAWLPGVSEDGDLSWSRSATDTPPATQNIRGTDGVNPTIRVAETITGEPGTDAYVENIGTETDAELVFHIPGAEEIAGGSGTIYIGSTSGVNTYTATVENFEEYKVGVPILVRFTNANTLACTLNINGLGAKSIVRNANIALLSGDIIANSIQQLVYDGTNLQLQTQGGSGGYVAGTYTGNGTVGRIIPLEFHPSAVLVMSQHGQTYYMNNSGVHYVYGGLAILNRGVTTPNGQFAIRIYPTGDTGFYVNYLPVASNNEAAANVNGTFYNYIAFR